MDRLTRRGLKLQTGLVVALAAGLIGGAGIALAASSEAAQAAKWQEKDLKFTYMGFTTHYTCDGLEEQVKVILRQLGARSDFKVREYGCTASLGKPDPFPSVHATFSVLVPLSDAELASTPADQVVNARWRTVQLKLDKDRLAAAGQCELVEQAKQKILPLFSTRNLNFSSECMPHQLTIAGAALQVDVMEPVPAK